MEEEVVWAEWGMIWVHVAMILSKIISPYKSYDYKVFKYESGLLIHSFQG